MASGAAALLFIQAPRRIIRIAREQREKEGRARTIRTLFCVYNIEMA